MRREQARLSSFSCHLSLSETDPEIVAMTEEVEQGLADMRRIRAEVQALRARQAVPYVLGKMGDVEGERGVSASASAKASTPPPVEVPNTPLPVMPARSSRLYSPAHTDKIKGVGGADLIMDVNEMSQIARSWKKD